MLHREGQWLPFRVSLLCRARFVCPCQRCDESKYSLALSPMTFVDRQLYSDWAHQRQHRETSARQRWISESFPSTAGRREHDGVLEHSAACELSRWQETS